MSTHALARVQTADTQSLPQRDAERMTVFKISSVTVLFMAGEAGCRVDGRDCGFSPGEEFWREAWFKQGKAVLKVLGQKVETWHVYPFSELPLVHKNLLSDRY